MLPAITISDFRGYRRLAENNFEEEEFQFYTDVYYDIYLKELVGDEAFLVMKNYPSSPLPLKWVDLLYGRTYFSEGLNRRVQSQGVLDVVKDMIFVSYVRDIDLNTMTGFVRNQNENSIAAPRNVIQLRAISVYNNAMSRYNLQTIPFIYQYKCLSKEFTNPVHDMGTSTWTLDVTDTEYLAIGDVITIDCIDYIVSDLTVNTSVDFVGSDSLTFDNMNLTYQPYEIVETCYQHHMLF